MSINKKKVLPTTIMFLVIVGVIVSFKSAFGADNTLVGVAGVTAALSLMGTDYTINPIKNTLYFIGIEVGLGIAAHIASTNAILGLIITFVVIFSILYTFTYNTKKPTYVAFTLGYLFMLYTPVSIKELPTRLVGLAFCGLAIMALQMLANKNKLQKETKSTIKSSIKSINEQIDLMINNEKLDIVNALNNDTYKNIKNIVSGIYKRIDKNIELPTNIMESFFMCNFLESINLTLGKIRNDKNFDKGYEESLNKIKTILNDIEKFSQEQMTNDEIIKSIINYLQENKEINSKHYLTYELQDAASILKYDLEAIKNESIENVHKKYFTKDILNNLNELKNNMHKDSLKFTFALRGAIVTGLGVFVVSAFNLEYGKWLVFSLSSIVQPYLEASKTKGKERIIGTIIGLILFEILFSIVKDPSGRTMIILIVGYTSNYQTVYKNQMICNTISALGAAAMTANMGTVSINRIIFVLIGTGLAILANNLILPYKMSDITKKEVNKIIKLNEEILTKLYNLGRSNLILDDEVKEMLIVNELAIKKVDANNATLLSKNIDDFLYNQRIFSNELRFLINNVKQLKKISKTELELCYDIDLLLNKQNSKEDTVEFLNNINESAKKLILIDVLELKDNILNSKQISKCITQEL
ncbi:MAG: FUSC family protein [Paraclostridium sp.]|uniref:FUSC family protein n=1 Tax=Paraclostridium sp. TaxID=2023273 RepID=UPI003F364C03